MTSKITFYNSNNDLKKVMYLGDYTERELKVYAMLKGFERITIEERRYCFFSSGLNKDNIKR